MDSRGITTVAAAAAVAGAAAVAVRRRRSGTAPRPDRWHVVTINRPAADVGDAARGWPAPVADLGERVEVRTRPAPGDRGTELAVRARPGTRPRGRKAQDLDDRIRLALRHARSLVETGDILLPDAPSTTRTTITAVPLEMAIRAARRKGRL